MSQNDNTTTSETAKTEKVERFVPMSDAVAKWVAENARPAEAPCLCGCGGTTKGRFVPGHDALLKETLRATLGERGGKGGSAAAKRSARKALATFGW